VARKIGYWISTAILALALLGSLTYLSGSEQVVSGFAKAGYPQHLRIVLGIAKPAAAIVLLLPGLPLLKEWAYAGVTFALIMATHLGLLHRGTMGPPAGALGTAGRLLPDQTRKPPGDSLASSRLTCERNHPLHGYPTQPIASTPPRYGQRGAAAAGATGDRDRW
jgi:hypothetical protein